ncbi:hypothetical protein NHX12_015285 [Muraenolepis orangiensis]|uniref:MADF domain-containing protein n=1 Tax=Muraenolepis orangiensis TaxID=630683 RepID=A0A9Q0DA65_9TELE|nr:hypothetical protein NHX12_015285 [Muraenolepis orangiensis]
MDTVGGKAALSVIYSGHKEDGANQTEGVAIMMTKETNNRRVKAHILQCYAPTKDAVDDVKARFYDSFNPTKLGRVGARDLIILMGDFNAKIGVRNEVYEEVTGNHGVGKMNENGEMFFETCVNNNLVIGGSSNASRASTSSQPTLGKRKRAKKTLFCLDVQEEQLMCDFICENAVLWDIKKTDYRRVDKKAKLWEDQAKAMGKTVEHLQGWLKSLRDTHTRLDKKKSCVGAPGTD